MKIKLTLEYEGSAFHGWQQQHGVRTVQSELLRALEIYLGSLAKRTQVELSEVPPITGSGRTDSGVHAEGQVASFSWPEQLPWEQRRFIAAMNGITVPQLAVLSAEPVSDSFDARFSPHTKCYRYRILMRGAGTRGLHHGRVWHIDKPLDVRAMISAAAYFQGTHDFCSFRAADCNAKSTVRTLLLSQLSRRSQAELYYYVHGNGFLKQMVRAMVGTLVDVGLGRLSPEQMEDVLAARNRSAAGQTAPACGLTLQWVRYHGE